MHLLLYIQYVQHWHKIACMLTSALAGEMETAFQDHNTLNLVLLKPEEKNKQKTPTVVAHQALVEG